MITFHKAKVEETVEIKELLRVTWNDAYSHIYSPKMIEQVRSEWHALELLTKQIQDPKVLFIVAKENNKIIAMCNTDVVKGDSINIQRLHVLPTYQRQGIGSKLLQKVIKAFPNASRVNLEVEKQNHRARALYKKHGFKEVGKKVFEVKGIRLPCIVMEKAI